jgi:hypothetical protein
MMPITPAAADVIRDWLQVSDTLADRKQLYPAIYPRSRFLWFFTTRVGGFRFASPLFDPSYARQVVMPWR